MNQTPTTDDLRTGPADLDRLLSDFFKAQLKRPWPAAPVVAPSEPSVLATQRAEPVRRPDSGRKARYTLAASVALLLGTCWYFSDGFRPAGDVPGTPGQPGVLRDATASDPAAVKEVQQTKAFDGDTGGFVPPKVKMP